jgi:hypothetical protein
MWVFDLCAAMFSVIVVIVGAVVIVRQYNKLKNPAPSLEEKIGYYEALNEKLRREQEV